MTTDRDPLVRPTIEATAKVWTPRLNAAERIALGNVMTRAFDLHQQDGDPLRAAGYVLYAAIHAANPTEAEPDPATRLPQALCELSEALLHNWHIEVTTARAARGLEAELTATLNGHLPGSDAPTEAP